MKITINELKKQSLQDFADEHDLNIVVQERSEGLGYEYGERVLRPQFYAQFKPMVEVCREKMLHSYYGDGITPEEAIKDYTEQISEKELSVTRTPGHPGERITAPVLTYVPNNLQEHGLAVERAKLAKLWEELDETANPYALEQRAWEKDCSRTKVIMDLRGSRLISKETYIDMLKKI